MFSLMSIGYSALFGVLMSALTNDTFLAAALGVMTFMSLVEARDRYQPWRMR